MTPEQLAEIEARAAAATPGEWRAKMRHKWEAANAVYFGPKRDDEAGCRLCQCYTSNPRPKSDTIDKQDYANAAFIAAARTDIPALIAEVRRLQAIAKEYDELLKAVGRLLNNPQAVDWMNLNEGADEIIAELEGLYFR